MIPNSKLIVGNWKLNPVSLAEAEQLTAGIRLPDPSEVEVVLLPPLVFLEELVKKFPRFLWGAQDFFYKSTGAYTGEISLPMLRDIGVTYVLVGHSDRRQKFGETDELVNKKLLAALEEGFKVILAVGELDKNQGSEPVIKSFKASMKNVPTGKFERLSVAYEPVWAISTSGTGEVDTPEHASDVISELQKILDVRYLYGGSVNSSNIDGFLAQSNINGALIGGASLKADEFSKILEAASGA